MMESIDNNQDYIKQSFINLIVLGQYCKDDDVLINAVTQVWKCIVGGFMNEMNQDPYTLLTKGIQQLLDNNNV